LNGNRSPSSSRALGWGLILLGATIGLVMLAWLLANYAGKALQLGGLVCGLGLLVVLAMPLLLSGAYLIVRARAESRQAESFTQSRALLEADGLARQQLAGELEQVVARLNETAQALPLEEAAAKEKLLAAGERLSALAANARSANRDELALLTSFALSPRDAPTLQSYDTLIVERARQLSRQVSRLGKRSGTSIAAQAEEVAEAVESVEEAYQRRQDLLLRGQRPTAAALERLTVDPLIEESGKLTRLSLGDVVACGGTNYLVQGKLTYFANGRRWYVYLLRDGQGERWLQVSEAGADLAFFEPVAASSAVPSEAGNSLAVVQLEDESFTLEEHESATVTVETEGGTDSGVFVESWLLASPSKRLLWIERWPEKTVTRTGRRIGVFDLQVFNR